MLSGKTILLGVTGGIAAYKAAALASALVKLHASVEVVMTRNATQFITPSLLNSSPGTGPWWTPLTATSPIRWSTSPWPTAPTW